MVPMLRSPALRAINPSVSVTVRQPYLILRLTLVGSSFTLVDVQEDISARSYSSSTGSSFTLAKGGEGDDLTDWVAARSFSYNGKFCYLDILRRNLSIVLMSISNSRVSLKQT